MDKTNILETRIMGLGSSDAKMIVSVGKSGKLNKTAQTRIAEMLGLKERRSFSTSAMELGNEIEDLIFKSVSSINSLAVSNPLYVSSEFDYGFAVLNHIDIEIESETELIWYEIKATIKSLDETIVTYSEQLSFHWMLLEEKARLFGKKPILKAVHYDTSSGVEQFDPKKISIKEIKYEDCLNLITLINNGLSIISNEIKDFKYEESDNGSNLPAQTQEILPKINHLLKLSKELEDQVTSLKEELKLAMEQNGIDSIDNEFFKVIFIPSGKQNRFDSKLFQKENPELHKKYSKETEVKSQIRVTLKD